MENVIKEMDLSIPNMISIDDVEKDVFYQGPFYHWLQNKPEVLKIEFPIKKRTLLDKALRRKVKSYKVKSTVNHVITNVRNEVSKLNTVNDIDIALNICATLILNRPQASNSQRVRIKTFITKNASITELLILVEVLIKHTGCILLYQAFKNKSLKIND